MLMAWEGVLKVTVGGGFMLPPLPP